MSLPAPLRLAVLFGGSSAEHEISLRSAREVIANLDESKYEPLMVGITRDGGWLGEEDSLRLLHGENPKEEGINPFLPEGTECVFPILHGPGGEDGKLQSWLELQGLPFVGSGSVGCALAMDKIISKIILRHAGLPVLSWTEVDARELKNDVINIKEKIASLRGFPCFVKPTSEGSSIGITRAETAAELLPALEEAFRYGPRCLVEPAVHEPREFEIAILDGAEPIVSCPGEICLKDGTWYSYEEKYEKDSAELVLEPEGLHPNLIASLRANALSAFRSLRMAGMARVDFLYSSSSGRFWLNEVNAIPGFTSISMYPRLLIEAGIAFPEILDRLVSFAVENDAVAPESLVASPRSDTNRCSSESLDEASNRAP